MSFRVMMPLDEALTEIRSGAVTDQRADELRRGLESAIANCERKAAHLSSIEGGSAALQLERLKRYRAALVELESRSA